MKEFYGHKAVTNILYKNLPPVTVLSGPESIGKGTLVEVLREHYEIESLNFFPGHTLMVEMADLAVDFLRMAPQHGNMRLAHFNIEDKVSVDALNVLLLTLEHLPETSHVIFTTNVPLPETITSRAQVFHMGLLTSPDLARVLMQERPNIKEAEAFKLAGLANGTAKSALNAWKTNDDKLPVLLVLKAFRERDPMILDSVADKWGYTQNYLLGKWAREAITRRWKIFNEEESGIESRMIPLKILMALRSNVRPRLMVRANLMNVLRGLDG